MARRLGSVPGVVLVAAAAAMWATDPLFRKPLANSIDATTIALSRERVHRARLGLEILGRSELTFMTSALGAGGLAVPVA